MYDNLIKVNIPMNEDEYKRGNGEGVWVEIDNETMTLYERDIEGGVYSGILANDSYYYPGLMCGDMILFEMRGEHRPVVCYKNFLDKLESITPEQKADLIRAIIINQLEREAEIDEEEGIEH